MSLPAIPVNDFANLRHLLEQSKTAKGATLHDIWDEIVGIIEDNVDIFIEIYDKFLKQ